MINRNIVQKFKVSGRELLQAGKYENAIEDFKQYCEKHTDDVEVLTMLADAHVAIKQNNVACDYYSRALAIDPVHKSNLLKLSALKLPGPNYIKALDAIHRRLAPQRYIEIGVCKGASFSLADPKITAIGIDPEPQLDINALPERHMVIRDTSDNYFNSGRINYDLNGESFDMAFLDGMHLFEYALRDFMNLEKYSNPNSAVLIHDVYPMNSETASRERISDFWSGDVWKLVLCLKEYRPDLKISVLPCPPTGLGVITGLDSTSTILSSSYTKIVEDYVDLPFTEIENDKSEKLMLLGIDSFWLSNAV